METHSAQPPVSYSARADFLLSKVQCTSQGNTPPYYSLLLVQNQSPSQESAKGRDVLPIAGKWLNQSRQRLRDSNEAQKAAVQALSVELNNIHGVRDLDLFMQSAGLHLPAEGDREGQVRHQLPTTTPGWLISPLKPPPSSSKPPRPAPAPTAVAAQPTPAATTHTTAKPQLPGRPPASSGTPHKAPTDAAPTTRPPPAQEAPGSPRAGVRELAREPAVPSAAGGGTAAADVGGGSSQDKQPSGGVPTPQPSADEAPASDQEFSFVTPEPNSDTPSLPVQRSAGQQMDPWERQAAEDHAAEPSGLEDAPPKKGTLQARHEAMQRGSSWPQQSARGLSDKAEDPHHRMQGIKDAPMAPDADAPGDGLQRLRTGSSVGDFETGEFDDEYEYEGPTLCSFCDDGGLVLLCDGQCNRAFHVGIQELSDDPQERRMDLRRMEARDKHLRQSEGSLIRHHEYCNALDMPVDLFHHIDTSGITWKCPNCLFQKFQCEICGKTDPLKAKDGKIQMVQCNVLECQKWYHPNCLRGMNINPDDVGWKCPQHRCAECLDTTEYEPYVGKGPLFVCRRCPRAYHLNCIPEAYRIPNKNIWANFTIDEVQPETDTNLMYCKKHARERPDDGQPPPHRPLWSEKLLIKWRDHYAQELRHLQSSKLWKKWRQEQQLSKVAAKAKVVLPPERPKKRPLSPKRAPVPVPPPAARYKPPIRTVLDDDDDDDDDDKPLQVKRIATAKVADKQRDDRADAAAPPAALTVVKQPVALQKKPVASTEVDLTQANDEQMGLIDRPEGKMAELRRCCDEAICSFDVCQRVEDLHGDLKTGALDDDGMGDVLRTVKQYSGLKFSKQRKIAMDLVDNLYDKADMVQSKWMADRRLNVASLWPPDHMRKVMSWVSTGHALLGPFQQLDRYTSFGRHFTTTGHLECICRLLEPLIQTGDLVVDFSCGSNEWLVMLQEHILLYTAREIDILGLDIVTAKYSHGFLLQDWFTATEPHRRRGFWHPIKKQFIPGDNLVIGLNPPFGPANEFVERAANCNPRLIVLIVPPATRTPQGFHVVYEDRHTLSDKSFYIPGTQMDSWNKTTPVVRVLQNLTIRPQEPTIQAHTWIQHGLPELSQLGEAFSPAGRPEQRKYWCNLLGWGSKEFGAGAVNGGSRGQR